MGLAELLAIVAATAKAAPDIARLIQTAAAGQEPSPAEIAASEERFLVLQAERNKLIAAAEHRISNGE